MLKAVKSKMIRLGPKWKGERTWSAQSHWDADSTGVILRNMWLQQLRKMVTQRFSRVSSRVRSFGGQRGSILEKHWTSCRIVGRLVRVSRITLLLCENKECGEMVKTINWPQLAWSLRKLVSRPWFASLVCASKCWYNSFFFFFFIPLLYSFLYSFIGLEGFL